MRYKYSTHCAGSTIELTSLLRLVTIPFISFSVKCYGLIHRLHISTFYYYIIVLQLQGLQCHLDILKSKKLLSIHNWKDLDVINWTITEQLQTPIQRDRYIEHILFTIR